jgi:hypothetical protein
MKIMRKIRKENKPKKGRKEEEDRSSVNYKT